MADTFELLKQEIMQTMESERDFAKWKLIVVAALGAAALGLGKDSVSPVFGPHYERWLLLVIPFACAYIDLHLYHCLNRIMVIAVFVRNYRNYPMSGTMTAGDKAMQDYEKFCEQARHEHAFSLGAQANLAASLIASVIAGGAFLWLRYGAATSATKCTWVVACVLIGIGLCLIVMLQQYQWRSLQNIEKLVHLLEPSSPKQP